MFIDSLGILIVSIITKTLHAGSPATKVDISEFCAGKKVLLVGVPGAFTPGCSMRHIPGYVAKIDEVKSKGIDEVAVLSVNDAFVMSAWQKDLKGEKLRFLADPRGEFAAAVGLAFDAAVLGAAPRMKRFSAVVQDGVVEQLNVEPDNTGMSCSLVDAIKL